MPGDLQASWVFESIFREPFDDGLVNEVFLSLPLSNPIHPCLRRAILLRRLASEVSRRTISATTLSSLELLEELRRGEGSAPSETLKAAYCAVAAHITADSLRCRDGEGFQDVVERLWRLRIGDLRRSEAAAGLTSPSLEALMKVTEAAAISDLASRAQLVAGDTLEAALVAAALFLFEVLDSSGPPFIDLLDLAVDVEEERSKVIDHPFAKSPAGAPAVAGPRINLSQSIQREELGIKNKDLESIFCDRGFDALSSPEVQRVRKGLFSSCAALQAVVRDPLPDALKSSDEVVHDISVEKGKCILMDREPNARTCEWDSLDFSSSGSSKRIRLPRSKEWKVSPLPNVGIYPVTLRRKKKRWSLLEEDTLREGVDKYGKGNWKCILSNYKDVFEKRTDVDLKDKWRNLTKSQFTTSSLHAL